MLRCFEWCSSCFVRGGETARRRDRDRRVRGGHFAVDDELMIYDELQQEEAVRAEQVARAATRAEPRDLAPSLRDESLIARLTHSLNASVPSSGRLSVTPDLSLSVDEKDEVSRVPSSESFVKTLESLGDDKVQKVVVESMWNVTRHRWRKRETTRLLGLFQLAVSLSLDASSQLELLHILSDLPPAVMGDSLAQQSSRVLVDVSKDVRDEMMRRRSMLSSPQRRQVDSAVAAFDATLKNLEINGTHMVKSIEDITLQHPQAKPIKSGSIEPHIALYFDILISILMTIPQFDRFRVLMSQMILSKQIPADTQLRTSLIELVFPSRPPTPANPTIQSTSTTTAVLLEPIEASPSNQHATAASSTSHV